MRSLKEMTVSCGDSIRFDIGFSGGSKDNLEFRHEGRLLTEGGGVRIQVEKEVASLIIEAATPEHSGLYECIMRTEGGEARCQVRCAVVESTSAVSQSTTTVVESAQLIQSVTATAAAVEKSDKK
jgi:Immunoglobulin I-set domain